MKNTIITMLLTLFLITSCKDDKIKDLENRISNIENQNKILNDSLDFVYAEFIEPFKMYEKIVLTEMENSPKQIITDYKNLIKHYPNSFWKHEAKKRIQNIEARKKYWSEEEGWKLPEKTKKPELIIEPMVISCPGC
jgi:outer membrane protein assembly factor BamD (BamD/ComL family)